MSVKFVFERDIRDEILKLIWEATQEITLVSPYNDDLEDLKNSLVGAHRKKAKIARYFQDGKTDPAKHFRNVISFPVESLHAKIYANEKAALVTSFNLNWSSWNKSREVGLLIQDAETVCEIKEYVKALSERGAKSRGAAKSPRGEMAKSNKGTKRDVRKRSDIPRGAQLTRTYKDKIYTCIVELPGG